MANGITQSNCLTHLTDVPFDAITSFLDHDDLEHFFDVLVRQQVKNIRPKKRPTEIKRLSKLRTGAKRAPDVSLKTKRIKKKYLLEIKREIALWSDILSDIPLPNILEALHLPADAPVNSIEEALELKRKLSSELQPFHVFQEEVMNDFANYLFTHLTNQEFRQFFMTYSERPNILSDHILTILFTSHPQLMINKLLPLGNYTIHSNIIVIQGRHWMRQKRYDLFSQLIPQCEQIPTLNHLLKILCESPWNKELFLHLISSPLYHQLLSVEPTTEQFALSFSKLLTRCHLQPLKDLLEYTQRDANLLSESYKQVLLQTLLDNKDRDGLRLLIDHLLCFDPTFFKRIPIQTSLALLFVLVDHNDIGRVIPILLEAYNEKNLILTTLLTPLMLIALALSKGHQELATAIMTSPPWTSNPLNQEIAGKFSLEQFLEKYQQLDRKSFLDCLVSAILPFSDITSSHMANKILHEHGDRVSYSLSHSTSFPELCIGALNTPAIMESLMKHLNATPYLFNSIFTNAMMRNLLLQDSTLLDYLTHHPQLAIIFQQFLAEQQQIHGEIPYQQIAYTVLGNLLENLTLEDDLASQNALIHASGLSLLLTEENLPHLTEQFIQHGLQDKLPFLIKFKVFSDPCLDHLRALYQHHPDILALLQRNP